MVKNGCLQIYLIVIMYTNNKTIKKNIVYSLNAKVFIDCMIKKFIKFSKSNKGHYLSMLEKMTYDAINRVYKHILKLIYLTYCVWSLFLFKLMFENSLVALTLISSLSSKPSSRSTLISSTHKWYPLSSSSILSSPLGNIPNDGA